MATSDSSTNARASSLDIAAWTGAAIELLAEQGIDGVRIELLARRLGVTKGSFYWHFANRDALHAAMLAEWRRLATLAVIERIEAESDSPENRLKMLMRVPFQMKRDSTGQVELSIRLWARRDPRARAALQEVDALRLRYIARLMTQMGLKAEKAESRAILAYAFQRVATSLIPRGDTAAVDRCIRELITP